MLLGATAVLSLGRHIAVLALGRFLQGLSAAVVWTSGLSLLTDILGPKRYGEAVGYAQTAVSVGTTSAPLVGGVVYARGGYTAVSAINMGTVAISIVLALIMVEPKADLGSGEPVPEFSVSGNNNDDAAYEEVSRMGPSMRSPTRIEAASYEPNERSALIQRKHKEGNFGDGPAYPLLLRSGRVLANMGGIFTYSVVIISFEGMIPLFVKETFHWDSTRAALIFLSWIIPGFLAPVAGKASDRLGPRWVAVGGLLFAALPLMFMRLVTTDSTLHKVLLCGLLTLVGKLSSCMPLSGAAHSRLMRELD